MKLTKRTVAAAEQERRDWINEQRRNRRLIRFRNCFCHEQATRVIGGNFLCEKHFQMERARTFQDPATTAANIRESNARSERQRVERLKSAGLCVTCGKREANPNATRCEVCQSKRRALQASYRAKSEATIHPWRAPL